MARIAQPVTNNTGAKAGTAYDVSLFKNGKKIYPACCSNIIKC
jgi:hypothetical protein